MCKYVTMCRYTSVYAGIYIVLIHQYKHIPTIPTHTCNSYIPTHTFDTYSYLQYLHIVICLHIPAIPVHTCNTCV